MRVKYMIFSRLRPKRRLIAVYTAFLILILPLLVFWRPNYVLSTFNSPQTNLSYVKKVHISSKVGQSFKIISGRIAQISFKMAESKADAETQLVFRIKRNVSDPKDLVKIETTLGAVRSEDNLIFNFKPVRGKNFYVDLAAPKLAEKEFLALRFQIDGSKYAQGEIYLNGVPSYGDLGFAVYSRPSFFRLIIDAVSLYAGFGLALILALTGLGFLFIPYSNNIKPKKRSSWNKKEIIASVFVFLFTVLSFAPLTNSYFRQDDFVILDRVRNLWENDPLLLVTNRGFVEASRSAVPVHIAFYRPLSNTIIPLFLYVFLGLQAHLHYLFNFVIHALNAVLIYYLFRHFLNRRISIIAVLFWSTHSSTFLTVYWLSSIQETLSLFFLIFSLICLGTYWRLWQIRYWLASVSLYTAAILSKENSFLFLGIAPLFLLAIDATGYSFRTRLQRILRTSSPFLLISSLVLIIRTWNLNDKGLLDAAIDTSYKISLNPFIAISNITASLAFATETWLFEKAGLKSAGTYIKLLGETNGWSARPPDEIVIIIMILLIIIIYGLIKSPLKKAALFPVAFYIISTIPFTFLLNERQERWLYLPLVGLSLSLGVSALRTAFILRILKGNFIFAGILITMFMFSQWMIKNNDGVKTAAEHSSFTKQAIPFIRNRYPSMPQNARVIITNMPADRQQNLGQAALPLIYKDSSIKTEYLENEPKVKLPGVIYFTFSRENNSLEELIISE